MSSYTHLNYIKIIFAEYPSTLLFLRVCIAVRTIHVSHLTQNEFIDHKKKAKYQFNKNKYCSE